MRFSFRVPVAPAAALAVAISIWAQGAAAQEAVPPASPSPPPLTVGLYVSPPFVMEVDGAFGGMAVELWEELAGGLHIAFDYVEYETFGGLIDAVEDGRADVAVSNLTINRERAERIDFTHPWFDAGLRVMVNQKLGSGFGSLLNGLYASGHLRAYAWIVFVLLVATVVLTLFDRSFDKNFPRRWRDGMAESFYTVMSVATSGRPAARKNLFGWVGRIWQALWLICGIAVLAYLTSSVTSVMTTLSLTSQINGPGDLPGRRVGVFTGSVAEDFARRNALNAHGFAHMDEAARGLLDGRIDAIVGDAPVLEYHTHANPTLPLDVVGVLFEPDKYGFGLPRESALTRPFNIELIGMHESGFIAGIRSRYFGEAN